MLDSYCQQSACPKFSNCNPHLASYTTQGLFLLKCTSLYYVVFGLLVLLKLCNLSVLLLVLGGFTVHPCCHVGAACQDNRLVMLCSLLVLIVCLTV